MRVAVAAEATWNNMPDMPVIVVQPYGASRIREGISELRYNGFLDATKEVDFFQTFL